MYSDIIQTVLRGAALTFSAIVLIVCAINFSHSRYILSVSAFMALDLAAFLCIRFSGVNISAISGDWATLIILHAATTTLALTVYIIVCRRQNGYAYK